VQRVGVDRARSATRGMPALIAGIGLLTVIIGWGPLALSGCSESSDRPCAPGADYGRIVGRIETGGVAVEASVRAQRTDLGDWRVDAFKVERPVDEQGRFALVVPAGEYTVAATIGDDYSSYRYAADGAEQGYRGEPDTLSVDTGDSVEVVFHFGSLIVEVAAAAPELNGMDASLNLHQVTEGQEFGGSTYSEVTIKNGVARFTLPGVPAGSYALEFGMDRSPYVEESIWLPGTHDPAAAAIVQVTPDAVATYAAELPDRPAVLRGRVFGSWQRFGMSPGAFSVLAADSSVILVARASEVDGSFRGAIWIPEPVRVACTIEGSTRWIGGDDFASATQFELAGGEEIDFGTIEESGLLVELIEPTYSDHSDFELKLVRAEDGAPARTLWVYSGSYDRTNLIPFPNLDPGTYRLFVSNSRLSMDWQSQWYDGAATSDAATPVTIPSGGAVVPITVTLQAGGAISGKVVTSSEDDPWAFVIYFVEATTRQTVGRIYCDCECGCVIAIYGDGFPFSAHGLADGNYRVGAWDGDCCAPPWDAPEGTIWYPGTAEWEAAQVVTIADHAAVTGVDIAWPPSAPRP
jgi:hypothetical protein